MMKIFNFVAIVFFFMKLKINTTFNIIYSKIFKVLVLKMYVFYILIWIKKYFIIKYFIAIDSFRFSLNYCD